MPHGIDDVPIKDVAVQYADAAKGQTRLSSMGYKRGVVERWTDLAGNRWAVVLCQFGSDTSAAEYNLEMQGIRDNGTLYSHSIVIPDISLGLVYQRKLLDDSERWQSDALFAKGTIAVDVYLDALAKGDTEPLMQLADAQYARLP